MCLYAVICTWPPCTSRHVHIIGKTTTTRKDITKFLSESEELRLLSVLCMANRTVQGMKSNTVYCKFDDIFTHNVEENLPLGVSHINTNNGTSIVIKVNTKVNSDNILFPAVFFCLTSFKKKPRIAHGLPVQGGIEQY